LGLPQARQGAYVDRLDREAAGSEHVLDRLSNSKVKVAVDAAQADEQLSTATVGLDETVSVGQSADGDGAV
jgi:hypothetical protein